MTHRRSQQNEYADPDKQMPEEMSTGLVTTNKGQRTDEVINHMEHHGNEQQKGGEEKRFCRLVSGVYASTRLTQIAP